MNLQEVADDLDLNWKTVKDIDKEVLQQEYKKTDYSDLKLLAVDEIVTPSITNI